MADDMIPPAENNTPPPPPEEASPPDQLPGAPDQDTPEQASFDDDLGPRLERLGGEPAPDITPEEFARLQQAGQIHIDPRGRVRTTDRDETDAGISLRKRRAWYTVP
ncbi:MAG: hypothetical protein JXJ20_01350 [Anaerolineae bacterium]|jgi:hypothetical protein|nr:hypothetical protein [Anaerolineae bacterium]